MNAIILAAFFLILVGASGLAYGGFTYTWETHDANLGPLEFSDQDRQTVNIPIWAGIGAIVIGGGLLFVRGGIS